MLVDFLYDFIVCKKGEISASFKAPRKMLASNDLLKLWCKKFAKIPESDFSYLAEW